LAAPIIADDSTFAFYMNGSNDDAIGIFRLAIPDLTFGASGDYKWADYGIYGTTPPDTQVVIASSQNEVSSGLHEILVSITGRQDLIDWGEGARATFALGRGDPLLDANPFDLLRPVRLESALFTWWDFSVAIVAQADLVGFLFGQVDPWNGIFLTQDASSGHDPRPIRTRRREHAVITGMNGLEFSAHVVASVRDW
jgi:hypothetical protein